MKEESFEDILEQSKRMTNRKRFEQINKKLWMGIGITGLFVVIAWPVIVPGMNMSFSDKITFAFIVEAMSFPILSGLLGLPIALLPIMGWKYPEKFYRVFLIIFFTLNTLMAITNIFGLFAIL